jgi:protein-tyrosine phosphatase
MKILMVCLGNICRSPLAEGILQHKANEAGLKWTIESAGTGSWHCGEPPHQLSQKIARLKGIDISSQRCRQFVREDMLSYDKIYVMDENNYEDVREISEELWDENKVDFLLNALFPGENRNVPDPWYGKEKNYHEVFELLNDACEVIIKNHFEEINSNKKQATSNPK